MFDVLKSNDAFIGNCFDDGGLERTVNCLLVVVDSVVVGPLSTFCIVICDSCFIASDIVWSIAWMRLRDESCRYNSKWAWEKEISSFF